MFLERLLVAAVVLAFLAMMHAPIEAALYGTWRWVAGQIGGAL